MDPNPNPDGQQQPYSNPQYIPLPNQQFTSASQHGYSQAPQQANPGQNFANYATTQSSYQTSMNAPAQQPAQNLQPQQQPSYECYQQGPFAPAPTPTSQSQSWSQALPNTQWQTATNNTSTTTTTTTTTKSTKERYASQQDHDSSSASTDFTSLMKQAPPQQMPQQPPPQQSLQQRQTTDYTQVVQSGYQQQQQPPPLPPPAPDYSQLSQTILQQSTTTTDFSQLIQAAPPSPPPQPQVSLAPPVFTPMEVTPVPPKPAKAKKPEKQANQTAQASSSAVTNKTTTTTTKTKKVDGGSSRQQAADKGKVELRKFDRQVSDRLKMSCGEICPMGWDFYAARQGYLCGGGYHLFSYEGVEAMLKHGRFPRVEVVNAEVYLRQVTPPPGNGNGSGTEPAFWTAEQQLAAGLSPIALLKDKRRR